MVISVESKIKNILSILRYLNFEPKSPKSLTSATLTTLGELIITISIKGVVTDDDLKWIRDYCNDITHFWETMPVWLRKALSRLKVSATFSARGLSQRYTENKINGIVTAYSELVSSFIRVYKKEA